jgi:UDP-N-acetyl-D-mannosaminuronic acid dehydrogenase
VQGMKRRMPEATLNGRKVAVLGLAFKGDTDDERDSLAHKLVRLLERELADVAVHDPLVPTPTQPLEAALRDADVVVGAANHAQFAAPATRQAIAALASGGCLVVDPWNHLGGGQVFAFADELAPLIAPHPPREP